MPALPDQPAALAHAHFGDLVDAIIYRDPLRALTHLARTYGDRVQINLGRQVVYLLSSADDIREVLMAQPQQFDKLRLLGVPRLRRLLGNGWFTNEREFQHLQHMLMQPSPQRQRMAAYATVMTTHAQRASARWREGTDVDMALEMQQLALGIVGETLFAIENDAGLNDARLRDEARIILPSGYRPMTNVLTWTWYLLSQQPDAEAQLHSELDTMLAGQAPTLDMIPRLRYTEMVLSESMRLYPPTWAMGRRALQDVELRGFWLPENAVVIMSQYVVQHSAQYYPDPERFDPERWTSTARATRPEFAYFPFGGGLHHSIGVSFAWMEGMLVLATLAQAWQARLVPGHPVKMQPGVTLRPKYGMRMTLHRRMLR